MFDNPASLPDDGDDDDPLVFAPVPSRARHDGWTAERQRDFIAHLARFGGVAAAARAVGMSAKSAYRLRARDGAEGFARAWDAAQGEGRVRAYERAVDRGVNGYLVPVRHLGRVVGYRHRHDNRLLFAACYGTPMVPRRREGDY